MTDELKALIDNLEIGLATAFLAAIAALRSGINFPALLAALRARDIDAAVDALNIERAAFSGYVIERQSGFGQAGALAADDVTKNRIAFFKRTDREPTLRGPELPPIELEPASPSGPIIPKPPSPPTLVAPGGGSVVFRFDMTNPRAEAKIRTEAATRVAGYVDEQIETARKVIADGFQKGQGPTTIATDIAGRINPVSGRREGGIVGLSDPQVGYVDSMRTRLGSGDPEQMIKVLGSFDKEGKWKPGTGLTLRDRRYDAQIKRAIRDIAAGKPNPLTDDRIEEMTAKYSDRLLARRAEDIARTETAQGVMLARAEATQQALDKSGLPDTAVEKTWMHSGDPIDARESHLAMNEKKAAGLNTPFFLPDGSVMLHSHDPAGGVKNNANCECNTDFAIDWAFGLK